ncbi:hypothetical protein [Streptomyces sp. NPDC057582]|uniref:hypothetical protein n=1 Tax=Streptomyces sp. NPDC057582 TaxID=3346174 RepID=UPI0036C2C993
MLLRLAYLGHDERLRDAAAAADERPEKDVEILALCHQIAVLERHLDGQRDRFDAGDRAFLASLLHGVPREVLRRMRPLVRPDTMLRRHRDLSPAPAENSSALVGAGVRGVGDVHGGRLSQCPRVVVDHHGMMIDHAGVVRLSGGLL